MFNYFKQKLFILKIVRYPRMHVYLNWELQAIICRRCMAEILPIRHKTLRIQSINLVIMNTEHRRQDLQKLKHIKIQR